jgi:hypothetical protein
MSPGRLLQRSGVLLCAFALHAAIRLFVLDFYRDQISEHEKRAGAREILGNAIPLVPKQGQ